MQKKNILNIRNNITCSTVLNTLYEDDKKIIIMNSNTNTISAGSGNDDDNSDKNNRLQPKEASLLYVGMKLYDSGI
jgi:hypothetical protein